MSTEVADLYVILRGRTDQFVSAMTTAGAKGETAMGRITRSVAAAGKAFAFAGLGVAAVSVDMAKNFDMSITRIGTLAHVGTAQLPGLSKAVLDLAGKVGFSPDSLAGARYHVESTFQSTGISGAKAISILQTASEGAAIGGADLVDVTNALDAAVVSGIPGVQNYQQAMGQLLAIVGSGDMTMQNLADALGTGVLAIAKVYGATLSDVGAALATFGDNNIRGAEAATYLRMTIMDLTHQSQAGQKALKDIGITSGELATDMQTGGLDKAILDLHDHLVAAGVPASKFGQVMEEAFTKKSSAPLAILLSELSQFQSKYPDLKRGADQFAKDWGLTQQQFSQQFNQVKSGAEALLITLGNKLIPMIQDVVHWGEKHTTLVKDLAIALGVTAVGAVVVWAGTVVANMARAGAAIIRWMITPLADMMTRTSEAGRLMQLQSAQVAESQQAEALATGTATDEMIAAIDARKAAMLSQGTAATEGAAQVEAADAGIVSSSAGAAAGIGGIGAAASRALGPLGLVASALLTLHTMGHDGPVLNMEQGAGSGDPLAAASYWTDQLQQNLQATGATAQSATADWLKWAQTANDHVIGGALSETHTSISKMTTALQGGQVAWDLYLDSVKKNSWVQQNQALPDLQALGTAYYQVMNAQAQATSSTSAQTTAEQLQADATSALSTALQGLQDGTLSTMQAQDSWQSGLFRISDSAQQNGTSLDRMTRAGLANHQMLLQVAQGAVDMINAEVKNHDPASQVISDMDSMRQQFINAADSAGFNKTQVQQLADQLLNVPPDVRTEIQVDTSQAIGAVQNLAGQFDNLANGVLQVIDTGAGSRRHRWIGLGGGWIPGAPGTPQPGLGHGGEYVLSTEMLAGRQAVDPKVLHGLLSGGQHLITGGAASSPAVGPAGVVVQVTVQGHLLDTPGLAAAIKTAMAQSGARNTSTYQGYSR